MGSLRVRPRTTNTRGLVLVGFAFIVTMLGTTMPTPLYPDLEAELGFGELMTTVVFAVYPLGVTTALLVCGPWSDQLGRKPMLFAALAFSALSAISFLLSATLGWVFLARLLSGFSAGIVTGTATAAIIDLAGEGAQAKAGLVAAVVNMGGLGLGPLLAGLLAANADDPLTAPFVLDLALIALATIGLTIAPEPVPRAEHVDLRPQALSVPRDIRAVFARAAIAGFAGFAMLGLFSAVSPAFLGKVLGHHSPVLVGVLVVSIFTASVVGQLSSVRMSTDRGLTLGCVFLIAGMTMIGTSLPLEILALLIVGGVVAGFGQGMSFRAGLVSVTAVSPPEKRAEISSAFFVALYVGIAIPVVGVGVAATVWGLVPAGVAFSVLVGSLAVIVLLLLVKGSRFAGTS